MRFSRSIWAALITALLVPFSAPPVAGAEPTEQKPLDIGATESVKVRLVTVDVLVLDKHDRTVPGLSAHDFELKVDGEARKVDTLDVSCPAGATGPPRAGKIGDWSEPPAVAGAPRKVVFAFDYLHLASLPCPDIGWPCLLQTQVISGVQKTLRNTPQGEEEIMIVALDGALRVEQPFTRDRAQVLDTLARMKNDVTLYAGHFEHASEKPLFNGLEALVSLLDTVPGSKALVLFSGGRGPGDTYDLDFRHLRDISTLARVSFYPVDCQGLYAARPFV